MYICTVFSLSIPLESIKVDGLLGCFCVLATGNSAVVSAGVHVSFQIMVSLDICSGVRLLDHMVVIVSVF